MAAEPVPTEAEGATPETTIPSMTERPDELLRQWATLETYHEVE